MHLTVKKCLNLLNFSGDGGEPGAGGPGIY